MESPAQVDEVPVYTKDEPNKPTEVLLTAKGVSFS